MTPAINNAPTEVSVAAPYTTITMDGGIRIPSVPALQTTPAAKGCEYPARTMPAITIEPTATTVAGEEPETAANRQQARTEAIARPPCKCPTEALAKRIIRRATPPVVMKAPASTKNGMAISVKCSDVSYILRDSEASESVPKNRMVRMEESPRATATGVPMNMNTNSMTKSAIVVICAPAGYRSGHHH